MMQPCQYGFKCPYCSINVDYDIICTYPYIQPDSTQEFYQPDEQDCALMPENTELHDILMAYDDESGKTKEVVFAECQRINRDCEMLVAKIRKHREEQDMQYQQEHKED